MSLNCYNVIRNSESTPAVQTMCCLGRPVESGHVHMLSRWFVTHTATQPWMGHKLTYIQRGSHYLWTVVYG